MIYIEISTPGGAWLLNVHGKVLLHGIFKTTGTDEKK
jgi:hypothetical protein